MGDVDSPLGVPLLVLLLHLILLEFSCRAKDLQLVHVNTPTNCTHCLKRSIVEFNNYSFFFNFSPFKVTGVSFSFTDLHALTNSAIC